MAFDVTNPIFGQHSFINPAMQINQPMKIRTSFLCLILLVSASLQAQKTSPSSARSLAELQQEFVNLRFGMFIHFNIPTFLDQDWADPEASPAIFNPGK